MFSRVVLPQPDGPMIMMNSPRLTVRSKLCSAKDSASPKPYRLVIELSLMIVSVSRADMLCFLSLQKLLFFLLLLL